MLPSAAFLSIPPALALSVLELWSAQEASGQPTFPRSQKWLPDWQCSPMLSLALVVGMRALLLAVSQWSVSRSVALMLIAFVPMCTQMLPRAGA